jgi:hypothetical protein
MEVMSIKVSQSSGFLILDSQSYFTEMVREACERRKIKTNMAMQSYLSGLLSFYLDAKNLHDESVNELGERQPQTMAEMLLVASQSEEREKQELLKKLAERSLYISGFFGDSLSRKAVDIDYYVGIGGVAYSSLADCVKEDTRASIYRTCSARFLDFVEVLTYISTESMIQSDTNILRLYDRYLRTGSEMAKEKLIEKGIITISEDQIKHTKQN